MKCLVSSNLSSPHNLSVCSKDNLTQFVVTCALVSAALGQEEAMEAAVEAAAPLALPGLPVAGAGLGAVHTNVAVPGQFSYVVSSLHPLNPATDTAGALVILIIITGELCAVYVVCP